MDPSFEVKIKIKGRQTNKRRRPTTPVDPDSLLPLTVSEEGGRSGGATTSSSSATSSTRWDHPFPAEEEEDMANCLILLAQGTTTTTNSFSQKHPAAATGSYECKTCSRCFPSFQALGGHRASHKKPKLLSPAEELPPLLLGYDDDHINDPALPLQISAAIATSCTDKYSKAIKAHGCTICGAGFVSGQALGGHMRRHRAILGVGGSPVVPVVPGRGRGYDEAEAEADQELGDHEKVPAVRNLLPDLDLNLPAPDEDDIEDHNHREQSKKIVFAANEKIPIFSASSLVDCHY
ncbi:hypothetical protein Dimus_007097 [Dionaea muscipula]